MIAAYNNQRTGISAPPKYGKPSSAYNAVVVHSVPSFLQPSSALSYLAIPAQNYPYFYYRDDAKNEQQNNFVNSFTTTLPPRKSVQVELNYKDDSVVEKVGENIVLQQKITTVDTAANTTEVPTNKSWSPNEASQDGVPGQQSISTQNSVESHPQSGSSKSNLPSRPIKLVGLNPIYALQSPYQRLAENFTFTPQSYYEPTANLQYAPYAFLRSPLVPSFGYRNVPRAVSDRSEIPLPNPAVPLASSISVLAPLIPQSFDFKSEHKPSPPTGLQSICENCLLPPTYAPYPSNFRLIGDPSTSNGLLPVCENCLLPPNYAPYPSGLKLLGPGESNQKPCSQETTTQVPPSLKSNLAYIFMPSHAVKKQ